ncbi:MAG: LysR family transcriptional regulator [Ruminiclostridium sp.]|nr:LysR family transcriptional regulator [Ruminiclostridium sp.]
MDQKKRKAILTAVELGNLTRAAETLGYTQSGLSYLITSLEEELGFPLLVRSRTGVRPTADCLAILPYFRDLERKLQQVEQVASDIRGLVTGTVTIGVFHSISRYWLPDILRDFDAQYPGITVHMLEGDQEALDAWLADGTIDIAFSSRSPGGSDLWIQFTEDEYFAILPENHRLAKVEAIALSALKDDPFILTSGDYDLPRLFQEAGFQPRIRWSSHDELTILALVKAGLGVSLLPGLHLQGDTSGAAVLPLHPRAYRQLGVSFSSLADLSPAAKRFLVSAKGTMGIADREY